MDLYVQQLNKSMLKLLKLSLEFANNNTDVVDTITSKTTKRSDFPD